MSELLNAITNWFGKNGAHGSSFKKLILLRLSADCSKSINWFAEVGQNEEAKAQFNEILGT